MCLLGPESLKAEFHGFETLGLRWRYISYLFTLLMSAFSLLISPAFLAKHLHSHTERSATTFSFFCQDKKRKDPLLR